MVASSQSPYRLWNLYYDLLYKIRLFKECTTKTAFPLLKEGESTVRSCPTKHESTNDCFEQVNLLCLISSNNNQMKRKQGKYNSNHKNSAKVEKTFLGKSPLHLLYSIRSSFWRRFEVLGPVVLVSANRWLRGIKMYRFPWYLTLVSTNRASSNPGLVR